MIVKCPFCPRVFEGSRTRVEDEIFLHLWKVHDHRSVEYMIENMYMSEELKEVIFDELGYEYVAWLVDSADIKDQ